MLLDLLFGSYRQRALTQLLLHPDSSYHVRELARLTGKALHPLQESLQREINPVIFTAAEFTRRIAAKETFVGNILANPKLFVIGTKHELAKLAGHPAFAIL